ncbi:MAG: sulfite exporter TauE/SafE family protein [Xanthobacteraceae bacterium]|nr:sulfite exporter TauE/SafE family protein [Xanthobacteraceae bacterium]
MSYLADSVFVWPTMGLLAFLSGLLRGFAGFGSSLLVVPVLGIVVGPVVAVTVATLLECLATMLLFIPAVKHANTRIVVPLALSASATIPLGHAALTIMNPSMSNLLISLVVVCLSVWLITGGAIGFPRGLSGRIFAGSLSGLLNGFGSAGGPPLLLYILAGPESAEVKRANVITASGLALIAAIASMHYFGLLEHSAVTGGLLLAPIFLIGGIVGVWLFRAAPEKYYQRVALSVLLVTSSVMFLVNLLRVAA